MVVEALEIRTQMMDMRQVDLRMEDVVQAIMATP